MIAPLLVFFLPLSLFRFLLERLLLRDIVHRRVSVVCVSRILTSLLNPFSLLSIPFPVSVSKRHCLCLSLQSSLITVHRSFAGYQSAVLSLGPACCSLFPCNIITVCILLPESSPFDSMPNLELFYSTGLWPEISFLSSSLFLVASVSP